MYQLLNKDVLPLFQCGQDDNLPNDKTRPDNLFVLAEWTNEVKDNKLSVIEDPIARNLLSLILVSDPSKRLSLEQILAHPYLSGAKVDRLLGQSAEFHVFISYRVSSDQEIARFLFEKLTSRGVKVWWDVKCLKDGENWEAGFCRGLINSAVFVCVLSRKALENFKNLEQGSKCDNVLLEHHLALELLQRGLLQKIFPLAVADTVPGSDDILAAIDWKSIYPAAPDVSVDTVENNVKQHLTNQSLGSPFQPGRTVVSVVDEIKKMQGTKIENGPWREKLLSAVDRIVNLCKEEGVEQESTSGAFVEAKEADTHYADIATENARLRYLLEQKDLEITTKDQVITDKNHVIATNHLQLTAKDQEMMEVIQYKTQAEILIDRLKRTAPHETIEIQRRVIAEKDAELAAVQEELTRLRSQHHK